MNVPPNVTTNKGMPLGDALYEIILMRNSGHPWSFIANYVGLPWQTCVSLHKVARKLGPRAKP